ncbi:hypothetical protein AAFF_G00232730 [Aldrovandia affinis]|uniref:Serine/threonine-protein kinase Nek4 n=1 Tax=Aldrovandia affinis TaxID=143900 RepID=A0AAD7W3L9_9TELE|nr:hypothetical protein AAFF_G00232730 [Aldrovandia affinis]
MESYTFIRIVGKGSYGEVNLVKHKTEAKQYVVKKLNLRTSSKRERRAAEQEAQLLSQLRHPNIVTYRESWEGEDCHLYIVMGFCEGGDLYHMLRQQKGELLPERQVVEWFVQIAMALQYLHEKHILHRDLKTQNIFLTKTNIIKVGDLGIARVLENQNDMASTLIGTPYYMSPELFSNKPYNYKSDVWALGCCVYEMATLKHAFNAKDMNSLVYRIVGGKLPQMPSKYNPQLGELIKSMLSKRPEERPDVKHILRQPYIKRQISIFLEATKEKTAKSKKKAPTSRPGSAAAPVLSANSKPERPPQPLLDPNKAEKMKEENQFRQHTPSSSTAAEPPTSPQRLAPKPRPTDDLNSTGASLATISNVDIDIPPAKERKHSRTRLLSPPGQRQSDVHANQTEETKPEKQDPVPFESHQRKQVVSVASSAGEEKRPLNGPVLEDSHPQHELRAAKDGILPSVEGQTNTADMEDRDDTIRLLQDAGSLIPTPEVKQSLDSTEKLLEPLFLLSYKSPQARTPSPSSSAGQRNKGRGQENRGDQANFKEVPPRPLPSPPRDAAMANVRKRSQGERAQKSKATASSCTSSSGDSAITVPKERPLSARERRRLKQSQEDFSYPVLPALRRASCGVTAERGQSHSQTVAVSRSASDLAIKTNTQYGGSSRRQSDEEDCGSSTSSTDRSEGDCKEGKSESGEMQDLVQLMTQTLRMDCRDAVCEPDGPGSTASPEFRLNRRYRDTLLLHGKAKDEQEEFHFNEFPSDSPSGPAKIRRAIEYLRTDVVKGLGVKLLDRVLDIMEEDDETARELRLREHMGEDKYQAYAVMVRQLKFFEEVAFRDLSVQCDAAEAPPPPPSSTRHSREQHEQRDASFPWRHHLHSDRKKMPPKRRADTSTALSGKKIKEEAETTESTLCSNKEALKAAATHNGKSAAHEQCHLSPESEFTNYEDEEEMTYYHEPRTDTLSLLMKIEKLQAELKYERHCRMMAEKELKECKEMNNLMAQMRESIFELRSVLDHTREEAEDIQIEVGDTVCVMDQGFSGMPENTAEDDKFTELPGGLKVQRNLYSRISETTDFKKYTSALLMLVFNRETLATHSLQGRKSSNSKEDFQKPPLPPEALTNIIEHVKIKFGIGYPRFKGVETTFYIRKEVCSSAVHQVRGALFHLCTGSPVQAGQFLRGLSQAQARGLPGSGAVLKKHQLRVPIGPVWI